MPTRSATTAWTGGLQDGTGRVELSSSGAGTFDVSFPKRAADDADGTTSPEELIAGAHSACYAMSLSNEVAKLGEVRIVPGMPVEAFIQTGDRTMISYLTKPLQDQMMRMFREK